MAGKKARAKERKGREPAKSEINPVFPKHFDTFELRATPNKGIGAFATRAMEAGTSFFKETPIMIFTKPDFLLGELEVAEDYRKLSEADKVLFDQARHDPSHVLHCKCKKGTASANSFGDPPKIYPIGSRFNHSCDPNMMMLSPVQGTFQTFRTLRPVAVGEELCFNYSCAKLSYLITAERKLELDDDVFHFECLCSLCQRPAAQRLASDMRRSLLRHLEFCLRIKGTFSETLQSSALRNTVVDPKLKRSGVYSLLYASLLEAEGINIGVDAYAAYAYTVLHVLNVAYHNKIMRISPRVVQEMRVWMRKAEDNVMLQYGDPSEGEALLGIRKAMDPICVPDNGELNWANLLGVAANMARTRVKLFSSIPP